MYKEIKTQKTSSKEKQNSKKKTIQIDNNNILTKKKENKKICSNSNNINIEYKTTKKESNGKLNHINLKSIIKKIDLFSLSLSKKYNNTNVAKNKIQRKKGKRPFTGLIKLKANKIKDELKTGKPSYTKEIRHTKKNSLKYLDNNNNNNNIDFSSLTSSDNRYRNKDFISRYNKNSKISTNIKKGRETLQKQNNSNNLYNIINNDYSNRNIKNIIKENRKKINQSHRRFFRVDNIDNNLKDLKSINNNDNSKEKKNTSIINNKRKVLGNSNNQSTSNFNIKNHKKINIIINGDLKKYFFKGKSTPKDNTNPKKNKLFIISNKNKLKSKPKTQKDNSKNTIPKPISSKFDLKLTKIPEDNNLCNTKSIT